MNKTLTLSLSLATVTLGITVFALSKRGPSYQFLEGSNLVSSDDARTGGNRVVRLDRFNLHEPYDEAWGKAENELCVNGGWKLGNGSPHFQKFVSKDHLTVCLIRGKVDQNYNFVDGTDQTDTFVVVQKVEK